MSNTEVNPAVPQKPKGPFDSLQPETNILLLGESGVGKSAFVNSFLNYVKFNSLGVAGAAELVCPVPVLVNVNDGTTDREIRVGFGEDEDVTSSLSPKLPQTYVFPIKKNINVRLIDTPDFSDDVNQIRDNMTKILTYSSQLEKLHAICFVMKSDLIRVGNYFDFCMRCLLSHLGPSAGNNVVFVLTGGLCSLEEKIGAAKVLNDKLDRFKDANRLEVKFPVVYIDVDGFKYPSAMKSGIVFDEETRKDYEASWKTSARYCLNVLQFAGEAEPIQMITSVNKTRRCVVDVIKPLIDALELAHYNVINLNIHNRDILQDDLRPKDLKQLMFIPQIIMKQTSLTDPAVICVMPGCSQKEMIQNVLKYRFTTKCNKLCYLNNAPDQLLDVEEVSSLIEDPNEHLCMHCKCSTWAHMQILYETELLTNVLETEMVQLKIDSKDDMILRQYTMVTKIHNYSAEYTEEIRAITKTLAQLMVFLRSTAISSFTDIFDQYMHLMIRINDSRPDIAKFYKMIKGLYENECAENNPAPLDNDILKSIEALYELKYTGKNIRQLHKKQQTVRTKEFKNTVKDCSVTKKQELNKITKKTDQVGVQKGAESVTKNSNIEDLQAKLKSLDLYKERGPNDKILLDLMVEYFKQEKADKTIPKEENLLEQNSEVLSKRQAKKLAKANVDKAGMKEECAPEQKSDVISKQQAKKLAKANVDKAGTKEESAPEQKSDVLSKRQAKKLAKANLEKAEQDEKGEGNPKEAKKKVIELKSADYKLTNVSKTMKQNNLLVNEPIVASGYSGGFINPTQFPNNFNQIPNQINNLPNNNPFVSDPNNFGNVPNQLLNNINPFLNNFNPNQFLNNPNQSPINHNQFPNNSNQFPNNPNQFPNNINQFVNNPNPQYGINMNNPFGPMPNQFVNAASFGYMNQFGSVPSTGSGEPKETGCKPKVKTPNQPNTPSKKAQKAVKKNPGQKKADTNDLKKKVNKNKKKGSTDKDNDSGLNIDLGMIQKLLNEHKDSKSMESVFVMLSSTKNKKHHDKSDEE